MGQPNSGLPSPSLQNVQSVHAEEETYENSPGAVFANHRLKKLKVPTFRADKIKLEDFWMLFWILNLVDQSNEPVNLKIARLRQYLFNSAWESIKGPGLRNRSTRKQKSQLKAYMDQLRKISQLRSTDVQGFEKFADLVRIKNKWDSLKQQQIRGQKKTGKFSPRA